MVAPLLPPWPEKAPGLRLVPDRLCLTGILYVLHNDVAWQRLPLELGFGSVKTCWRGWGRWLPWPCEPSSGPRSRKCRGRGPGSAIAEGADRR
ncbi:transposase [Streptomyces sp. LX-29]|uniref:transposase n=1 Tax=Streptomyces sp. LX-29 TaxID=2900152 RepID=UPI00240D10C9|nr:transposase [Streptomyces sp. LX-29]